MTIDEQATTTTPTVGHPAAATRVLVVGSGWHFLSGISYYTCRLSNALAERFDVSAILMRRLLPAFLYPGRERVGRPLNDVAYAAGVRVFDGIDWYAVPTLLRAVAFLRRRRPDVLVLQWWTGTVLHSYLVLAVAARLLGARVVLELHEVQDTGEARRRLAAGYVRRLMTVLLRLVDAVVVHSGYDRDLLARTYRLAGKPSTLIPHGPYDQHRPAAAGRDSGPGRSHDASNGAAPVLGFAPAPGVTRLLFFGTIRPYKGLEDLIRAFDALSDEDADRLRLTVVGETWEGWTLPADLIRDSARARHIAFVNRYVTDAEATAAFAAADAVVLPYRRSSASGPLHIAMSNGLPVVVTAVGGLVEAADGYAGALLVPPGEPAALARALVQVPRMTGRRYRDPHSWTDSVDRYHQLFAELGLPAGVPRPGMRASGRPAPTYPPNSGKEHR